MKILNLYAGLGGNRPAFKDHKVTAVELNADVANIYNKRFPQDLVLIRDAHQYLIDHFQEFDFIWSSPPCQTHSRIRYALGWHGAKGKKPVEPKYPDMKLYEEIILLQKWFKGDWVVENVIGYYPPLIKPQTLATHYFWSNKELPNLPQIDRHHKSTPRADQLAIKKGVDFQLVEKLKNARQHLRNMVEVETAEKIMEVFTKTESKEYEQNNQ